QQRPYQQVCLLFLLFVCVSVTSNAQNPNPSPGPGATPPPPTTSPALSQPPLPQATPVLNAITLDEALRLADAQASTYQTARLNEQIATEDVKQAQAAFMPKVSAPLGYIYTTPALGLPPGTPREPSFIANNAVGEYEALANVAGDFDIAGRLRATLA